MTPLIALAALALFTLIVVWPRTADAHCDTLDGPAVADGRRALVTGNLAHALKWIPTEAEAELREVFDACSRVRTQGGEATTVADRLFLETLVRLHRRHVRRLLADGRASRAEVTSVAREAWREVPAFGTLRARLAARFGRRGG